MKPETREKMLRKIFLYFYDRTRNLKWLYLTLSEKGNIRRSLYVNDGYYSLHSQKKQVHQLFSEQKHSLHFQREKRSKLVNNNIPSSCITSFTESLHHTGVRNRAYRRCPLLYIKSQTGRWKTSPQQLTPSPPSLLPLISIPAHPMHLEHTQFL